MMKKASPAKEDRSPGGPIICPGHSRPVPDLEYSRVTQDGYFIISSCLDGKAMLREGVSGDWIGTFIGHKGAVWSARLNADSTQAVTGAADFTARLWDAVTGTSLEIFEHKHIVKTTIFSEDGKHIFTGGAEKKLRIFDLNKPTQPDILEGHMSTISDIVSVPDENLVVSCAAENNIRVWDRRTLTTVKTLLTDKPATGMTLSNDRSIISTTAGNTVTFWDSKTFAKVHSFDLERQVDCVAYHPATKRFATGSDSELWVRVYDADSGAEVSCNKGHHGPVRSLAFSPSGSNYASGSEDGTIRIWDTATSNAKPKAPSADTPAEVAE